MGGATPCPALAVVRRCKVSFFLHSSHPPPEPPDPPQAHCRCSVRKGAGVRGRTGAAAGFIAIWTRVLMGDDLLYPDEFVLHWPRSWHVVASCERRPVRSRSRLIGVCHRLGL